MNDTIVFLVELFAVANYAVSQVYRSAGEFR